MPIASVILPVLNGEKYIAQAIESILMQTLSDFEFIIINDGSTDLTLKIIEDFNDPRISIIDHKNKCGVAKSLNEAIQVATGKYIIRMDSDDIAFPERLKTIVLFMESHSEVGLCGSAVEVFGAEQGVIKYPLTHDAIVARQLFTPALNHPTVCFRRDLFLSEGLLYQENPPTAEDYELWYRASTLTKIANLPDVLLRYRIDPSIKFSKYLKEQQLGAQVIREKQLRAFSLDESEYEVFHNICNGDIPKSTTELISQGKLLQLLMYSNKVNRVYNSGALKSSVSHFWYSQCLRSGDLGFVLFRCIINPFNPYPRLNIIRSCKLIIQLLLKKLFSFRS